MDQVVKAIEDRIAELRQEIKFLEDQRKVFKVGPNPPAELDWDEAWEYVKNRQEVTNAELRKRFGVPSDSAYAFIKDHLDRKILKDATPSKKHHKKYQLTNKGLRLAGITTATSTTPKIEATIKEVAERVESKPKPESRPRVGTKKRSDTVPAARLNKFLEENQLFTVKEMAKATGYGENTSALYMRLNSPKWRDKFVIHHRPTPNENAQGHGNILRSIVYRPKRETVVRPGEGIREGRLSTSSRPTI